MLIALYAPQERQLFCAAAHQLKPRMTIHVVGTFAIHTGYMEVAPPFNKVRYGDINLLSLEFPKETTCIGDPLGVPCYRIVGQCTHKFAVRTQGNLTQPQHLSFV